jgi:phosphatidylinositol alpha-1,6-mannosyltransferase
LYKLELKNIVLLASEFPPLPGGIGNHAYNLALNFSKLGHNITVITDYRVNQKEIEIDFDSSLPFLVIRIERKNNLLFTYLNRILAAKKTINKHKNSVIFASGRFSLWTVGILNFFKKNKNSFSVIHGSELFSGNYFEQKLTKYSLSSFHKNIAVSNFTRDLISKVNPNLEVEVINNGFSKIDIEEGEVFNKVKDKLSIITVGNVSQRKGQQNVIRALPSLLVKYPKIQYEIVGIPTEKESLLNLATQLGVDDHVYFHGAVSNNELKYLLKKSTVFFMLSNVLSNGDVEGFGIAILEANSLGIPAIGSSNSGISDAIKHKFSGLVVDSKNSEEVSAAFDLIMKDYEVYSENAIQWSFNFQWDLIIQKYNQVIEL